MKNKLILILFISFLLGITSCLIFKTIKETQNTNAFHEYYSERLNQFKIENDNVSNVDVCFIGDSLTDGYDVKNYYSDLCVLNRGIGGDRTKDVLIRLDVSLYQVNPKVVVLLIGGNDVLAGKNIEYILHNISRIILQIRANLPNTKILIQSFYPLALNYARHNKTMQELNVLVKQLASIFNVTYLDVYSSLVDQSTSELNLTYTPDSVHLTSSGYEVVTKILRPAIDSLLNNVL